MKIKTFLTLLLPLLSICKSNSQDEKIVIQTVFHFVHQNFTEKNIPDSSVKYVLQKVNEGFNSVNKELIVDEYKDRVASCNIFFEFATSDVNGKKIDPISWHATDKKSFTPYINDEALKKNGYLDSSKYLNIWVCNISADLAGGYTASKLFSNIPPELDGIVIDIDEFTNETSYYLVAHEIGHWLGLNHIWGKTGTNSIVHNCMDDDGIFDTPQQKSPNILTRIPELSCDGFIYSNHQNFMDYSYDVGMFTNGQKDYMRKYIKEKRSGLIKSKNESPLPSVLNSTKQRDKFGTRMIVNNLYPFGTITDRDMVELFNSIGIVPTADVLRNLGLEIIGNDEFKDIGTGKEVNQDYIYKYLDIDKAKSRYKANVSKKEEAEASIATYKVGFLNPNYYSRKVILTNKSTKARYTVNVARAGINYGDTKTTWYQLPLGSYTCEVFTTFSKKRIRSFEITIAKGMQQIELRKNGYN